MTRRLSPAENDGYTYTDRVSPRDAGASVLDYYSTRYPRWRRDRWRARIGSGAVLRNDEPVADPDVPLCAGDRLDYRRAPWVEPSVPIDVVVSHDDGDLLAVSKPAGLPVIPDHVHLRHTLLAWVREHVSARAAPLHRLDRGTSGLVLFARRAETRRRLSAAWSTGVVAKDYVAHCRGVVPRGPSVVDVAIGIEPHPELGHLHVAHAGGKPSRSIVVGCGRVGEGPVTSRAEVRLVTGRAHQARIHLARVGHPIVGDGVYGPEENAGARPSRPGDGGFRLHAARLSFPHPDTGSPVRVDAPRAEWDRTA
ncbi:MAG: RluA family pseudouridine synthase [Acidimicrobiia bacterium]|nr:RluA family pseudouridine synthase [Acidimicrobiia bacterium]